MNLLFGIAAVLLSIAGGLYLLSSGSASEELTVFDSLFRGIGLYLIARGFWMLQALRLPTRRATAVAPAPMGSTGTKDLVRFLGSGENR